MFEGFWEYITNEEDIHYMLTNYKAPNYRVVAIDIRNPREVFFQIEIYYSKS
jgi:hypothetical protein